LISTRKLALALFLDHGVTKHWHRPVIRLGPGTCLTPGDPIQDQYRLQENDAVFIDLGSVWHDSESDLSYETDVGDTFVFGTNLEAEKCAETARDLFSQAQTAWKNQALTGEQIYQFLKEKAEKENYHLVEKVNGHRIADFPHHSYSKDRLGRLSFHPSSSLWVLEVQIRHPSLNFGAFFEDIL